MADKTYKNLRGEDPTAHEDEATNITGDSYTRKHLFDDGVTTYHEDGTTSETQESFFGDGYITRHSDGSISRSHKKKTFSGDETIVTVHEDGSSSVTSIDKYGNLRTRHSNGSETVGNRDSFGTGYTTHDTGVHYPPSDSGGQTGSDSTGGELILFPIIAIIAIWIILVGIKVRWAIVLLPLLIATIIIRIKLNQKYETGFFYLWLHPATILCWNLLAHNFAYYMDNTDDGAGSIFVLGGMIFTGLGILVGINICKERHRDWLDNFPYILYAFFSFVFNIAAPINYIIYTVLPLFGLALIATPIWVLKKKKRKP